MPGVLGIRGRPPVPAPPGPGTLEVPILAVGLAPGPVPAFALPVPAPALALPESGPVELPEPLPEPPMPGALPPDGDMASAPRSPLVGAPRAAPGLLEMMAAALWVVPPALAGGATIVPCAIGCPAPEPMWPKPRPASKVPPEMLGGGGTTLAFKLGTLRPVTCPRLVSGGGGTTSTLGRTAN